MERDCAGLTSRTEAADVILLLVLENPGCRRRLVLNHSAWRERAGWPRQPHLDTVGDAVRALERVDPPLLERRGQDWYLTPAGVERARQVAREVQLLTSARMRA
ncbi:hypothetical protein I0C86_40740 [Plantactinospora sp. S1510]|uniref:Uncharacterized protein n=1 Tax=Plantactinospora alkalitolerans TaxID=2789879 RepID=A0ABS0HA60_9ACTN|nr:hypothetical protein [Plantactinospora alkalitolerans]MBF9135209.1 hypothetical protein [Plantactinospora alkalitolerans]